MTEHEILLRAYRETQRMINEQIDFNNKYYKKTYGYDNIMSRKFIQNYQSEAQELIERMEKLKEEQ